VNRSTLARLLYDVHCALVLEYNGIAEPSHPHARGLARLIQRVERARRALGAVLVLVLVVAAGCNAEPADPYVGTWTGSVEQRAATCGDGTIAPASTSAVELAIDRTAPDALVVHAACGELHFTVRANFAQLDAAATCSAELRIDRAMLRVTDAGALQLDYNATAGVCPLLFTGTLERGR
jgi:hypothetical protein